ncbi:LRR receptor-like serine/threonine-protein kinase FLS2 [Vitis vinifera]|uniref:LRR receptor-like serine/threonine-protein kinase FLS2 n=1 Tax=Vitis vinifera TaxID=29760 RepID=A0A438JV68_VITVI|nr:LRR receptor-like serine/threonine-protein kinase FLS2 [Vitis vinifera]
MTGNNFSGSIPPQLFHLPLLQYLSLDGNSFSGKVLVEIGNLSSLQVLFLSGNRFSGVLLSVSSKGGLEFLDLSDNDLSTEIPTEIGNLPNISTLALSNNRLTGGIPSSMQKLIKLEKLYLQNNLLTGEIPSWLFHFKGLRDLYLGGNRLIWNDSVEIAPNPRPFRLSLKSCGLVGEVPKWISTQADNEFTGSLPPGLFSRLNSLGALALSRNNFSGELPKNIGDATFLRNRFSGPFPVFYPEVRLAYIDFSSNDFSGEVPTTFPKETRFLALGGNKFSGGLPLNLTNLSKLERLELQDNNLTGELPNFLSQISTLQVLNLRNNSFQGLIPESIFNLSNLRILDASKNCLDFTERWSSQEVQVSLEFRDLIVNWKNSKQASLGALKALKLLNISHNKLSGKIPTSFGDLENIESLDMSHNKLSGSIPQTLTKLQQLTILDVSNNQLTGRIPDGGQMGTMVLDPNYYANNSGLCGIQIHVSCPEDEPPPPTKPQEHDQKEPWFFMGRCMDWVPGWLLVSNRNHISNRVFYLTTTFKPSASPTTSNQAMELNQNIRSRGGLHKQ